MTVERRQAAQAFDQSGSVSTAGGSFCFHSVGGTASVRWFSFRRDQADLGQLDLQQFGQFQRVPESLSQTVVVSRALTRCFVQNLLESPIAAYGNCG